MKPSGKSTKKRKSKEKRKTKKKKTKKVLLFLYRLPRPPENSRRRKRALTFFHSVGEKISLKRPLQQAAISLHSCRATPATSGGGGREQRHTQPQGANRRPKPYNLSSRELEEVLKLSGHGEIGNPVWQILGEMHGDKRLKMPRLFLLKRLRDSVGLITDSSYEHSGTRNKSASSQQKQPAKQPAKATSKSNQQSNNDERKQSNRHAALLPPQMRTGWCGTK